MGAGTRFPKATPWRVVLGLPETNAEVRGRAQGRKMKPPRLLTGRGLVSLGEICYGPRCEQGRANDSTPVAEKQQLLHKRTNVAFPQQPFLFRRPRHESLCALRWRPLRKVDLPNKSLALSAPDNERHDAKVTPIRHQGGPGGYRPSARKGWGTLSTQAVEAPRLGVMGKRGLL